MNNTIFLTASEIAEAIRERKVSAVEVLEDHLSHIANFNPVINALVTLDVDSARRSARNLDELQNRGEVLGALHGVPITIKDAFETAGLRTTCSYRPLANYVPKQDATVVARLRNAGAIVLGKTNLPELASDFQCDSPLFGRANNPWNLSRTTGGSTGGGAAAVAAGLSALEIGSDLGGSIRLPAHYCGVFGFKPTQNLVSTAGHIPPVPETPRSVRHLGVVGPLARSIADLQLCLGLIAGPDARDWEVPPISVKPPLPNTRPLRIVWTDDFGGVPITAKTREVMENLVAKLKTLGCTIEKSCPGDLDFERTWLNGEILGVEIATSITRTKRALGWLLNPVLNRNNPIRYGLCLGLRQGMQRYTRALDYRDKVTAVIESFLQHFDAWLCPVASTPAISHRHAEGYVSGQVQVDDRWIPYWVAAASHTSIFNLSGNPAVVIPAGYSSDGLPIGIQIVGPRWGDMELLSVAQRITCATGPFARPPGY